MSNVQEVAHPAGYDYMSGSPHLKHPGLRSRIDRSILEEVALINGRRGACRALEIGAGHGSFTGVLRRAGADVTVTEMSGPSAEYLRQVFSPDPGVRVVDDPAGTWLDQTEDRFDLVVMISVIHHIPDYVGTIARCVDLIDPGGSFLSWQDPLWYPRRRRSALLVSRASYLIWRAGQGNVTRGVRTAIRRLRGVLDENEVSDMSEYHVVRSGVDEEAVLALLKSRFGDANQVTYWSTQAGSLQTAGERLGLSSSFGTLAREKLEEPSSR